MNPFCDYLKDISVKCAPCVENGIGACHVKLGLQEYYPKDFALYDTIQIIRHNGRLTVETDIEVKYKTKFPGVQPQDEFDEESIAKENNIKGYLEPKLPPGVRLLAFHLHFHPELPGIEDTVAIHVHAHKQVEDLDEAKVVVQKLIETIKPSEIEAAIAQGS